MLDPTQTSLICPHNDLESETILDIANNKIDGLDVHKITGEWGLNLETAFAQIGDLNQLRKHVVIVELPAKTTELEDLKRLGKIPHIVDHHQYSSTSPKSQASSLEQFAELFDYKLSKEQHILAINDRDFLPGLSKVGVSLEEAKRIRQAELELRKQVENREKAQKYLAEKYPPRDLHDLQLILAPVEYEGVMLEVAQFPPDSDYEKAAKKREPVKLKPTLILYYQEEEKPENICQIVYAGPAHQRAEITALLTEPQWENDFTWWLGGGEYGCFCGAKCKHNFADVNSLVSRLLGITLYLGRPLRHYGCTFYLPLDLFLDDELQNKGKLLEVTH